MSVVQLTEIPSYKPLRRLPSCLDRIDNPKWIRDVRGQLRAVLDDCLPPSHAASIAPFNAALVAAHAEEQAEGVFEATPSMVSAALKTLGPGGGPGFDGPNVVDGSGCLVLCAAAAAASGPVQRQRLPPASGI